VFEFVFIIRECGCEGVSCSSKRSQRRRVYDDLDEQSDECERRVSPGTRGSVHDDITSLQLIQHQPTERGRDDSIAILSEEMVWMLLF
jgi:hypothetical protein